MRSLYFPSPGSIAWYHSQVARFFVPGSDVGRVTQLFEQLAHFTRIVAFIQAKMLRLCFARCRALYDYVAKGRFIQGDVVAVSPSYFYRDGQTRAFDQHAALDPLFTSVSGISSAFFPTPDRGELWSSHHRQPTIPSLYRFGHRIQLNSVATALEKHRLQPTTGSGRERYWKHLKNVARTSIDRLFLIGRRCGGHSYEDDHFSSLEVEAAR